MKNPSEIGVPLLFLFSFFLLFLLAGTRHACCRSCSGTHWYARLWSIERGGTQEVPRPPGYAANRIRKGANRQGVLPHLGEGPVAPVAHNAAVENRHPGCTEGVEGQVLPYRFLWHR